MKPILSIGVQMFYNFKTNGGFRIIMSDPKIPNRNLQMDLIMIDDNLESFYEYRQNCSDLEDFIKKELK